MRANPRESGLISELIRAICPHDARHNHPSVNGIRCHGLLETWEDGVDSVRGSSLLRYDQLLDQHGVSAPQLLHRHAITHDIVGEYAKTLRYRALVQLFQTSAHETGLSHFGMELATRQGSQMLGPLHHLAQTAATVGEGLQAVLTYLHHYSPAIRFTLTPRRNDVLLCFENGLTTPLLAPQIVEKSLLHGCLLIADLIGDACRPLAVLLRHSALSKPSLYRRYFRCPIHFSQPRNAVVLDRDELLRPCVRVDPTLHAIIRFYLDAQVAPQAGLRAQVRQQMRQLLPQQRCSLQQVAQELGMATRTLQRRLDEEGVEFEAEREQLRRSLAQELLVHSQLSMAEVAKELGYRCTTSFCRAHQRWFGMAPLAHRRAKAADPATPQASGSHAG